MFSLNLYLTPEFIQNTVLGTASLIGIIWVFSASLKPRL